MAKPIVYCNTGKTGWSTYYDAYFLKKYISGFSFVLKSTIDPPKDKKALVLFTDPGAYCVMAKKYASHQNQIVCWWHGDSSTKNEGVKNRIPIAEKYLPNCRRVIVSCDQGLDSVLKIGVKKSNIVKIPLGVDMSIFKPMDKTLMRQKYGIPTDAFCIGSFQRDTDKRGGPKWIKGPDVVFRAIEAASKTIKNIFVLLSGPRRSYIVKNLRSSNINVKHVELDSFFDMPQIYNCLDCYVVGSRVEGGPKALIESIACEVPIVSTNCGMAKDVIVQEKNGFLCEIDDFHALSESIIKVWEGKISPAGLRNCAIDFDYESNICPQYAQLFKTVVK